MQSLLAEPNNKKEDERTMRWFAVRSKKTWLAAYAVKAHGGKLWIGENNPGGSVRFTLRIAEVE